MINKCFPALLQPFVSSSFFWCQEEGPAPSSSSWSERKEDETKGKENSFIDWKFGFIKIPPPASLQSRDDDRVSGETLIDMRECNEWSSCMAFKDVKNVSFNPKEWICPSVSGFIIMRQEFVFFASCVREKIQLTPQQKPWVLSWGSPKWKMRDINSNSTGLHSLQSVKETVR